MLLPTLLILPLLPLLTALPFSIYPGLSLLTIRDTPNQCAAGTSWDASSAKCIKQNAVTPTPLYAAVPSTDKTLQTSPTWDTTPVLCPNGNIYDLVKQTCISRTTLRQRLRMPCLGDKKYDHFARKCVSAAEFNKKYPAPVDGACATGMYFDHSQRRCVQYAGKYTKEGRRAYTCRTYLRWDEMQQRCVQRWNSRKMGTGSSACPAGMWLEDKSGGKDPTAQRCVVGEKETSCATGFRWEKGKGCQKVTCAAGQRFDDGKKQCTVDQVVGNMGAVARVSCPSGQRFDEALKRCVFQQTKRDVTSGDKPAEDTAYEVVPLETRSDSEDAAAQDGIDQYERRRWDRGADHHHHEEGHLLLQQRDFGGDAEVVRMDQNGQVTEVERRRDTAMDGAVEDGAPEVQTREVDGVQQDAEPAVEQRDLDVAYIENLNAAPGVERRHEDAVMDDAADIERRELDEATDAEIERREHDEASSGDVRIQYD